MTSLKRKLTHALNVKKKGNLTLIQSKHLERSCFNMPCYDLASFLLGKVIVHRVDNVILKGRIVETECYPGGEDKASHSFNGRRTPGNEPMYMEPGTAYVYKIYGIYHCFNISSAEPGGAVLIRALEPVSGINKMKELRSKIGRSSKEIKVNNLCKGPSKLCISMNITKEECNKIDLCTNTELWLEFDESFQADFEIIYSTRIGIQSAGEESVNKLLRFYIKDNKNVSKRDRQKELCM